MIEEIKKEINQIKKKLEEAEHSLFNEIQKEEKIKENVFKNMMIPKINKIKIRFKSVYCDEFIFESYLNTKEFDYILYDRALKFERGMLIIKNKRFTNNEFKMEIKIKNKNLDFILNKYNLILRIGEAKRFKKYHEYQIDLLNNIINN